MFKIFSISALFLALGVFAVPEAVAANNPCRAMVTTSTAKSAFKRTNNLAKSEPSIENTQKIIAVLDELLEQQDKLCPFEIATALEMRGGYKLKLGAEHHPAGAADLEAAFKLNILPGDRARKLRNVAANTHYKLQNYTEAVRILREDIASIQSMGIEVSKSTWFLLSLALFANQSFEEAIMPAEKTVFQGDFEPEQMFFILLDNLYHKTDRAEDRLVLAKQFAEAFPSSGYYAQLVSDLQNGLTPDAVVIDPAQTTLLSLSASYREAVLARHYPPKYPKNCNRPTTAGVRKKVVVGFDVTTNGDTENLSIVETDLECLNQYALGSVRKWKFQPKLLNGEIVRQNNLTKTIVFILTQ